MNVSAPDGIRLRHARADELAGLSDLCLRSKAVWGYDAALMAACRRELTITAEQLTQTELRVAELHVAELQTGGDRARPIGLGQIAVVGAEAELLKLFIDPDYLGRGCGRLLYDWAVAAARQAGAVRMTIDADPGAVPFYVRMGARPAGLVPSGSIPGRLLPCLDVALHADCDISPVGAGPVGEDR